MHDTEVWHSPRAGVEFKSVPGARAAPGWYGPRAVEPDAVAHSYAPVEKTDRDDESRQQMRLLTQPIFRYASPQAGIIDGTMFAFVQGTDPEVFLQVEARQSFPRELPGTLDCRE